MSEIIQNQEMDALMGAFLAPTEDVIVKAEDIELGGGIDYSKTYFDPQVGQTYTIKFIKNVEGLDSIVHRKVYKNLPDPTRKGKTFYVVSSGVAKTCKTLELFFELHEASKNGDALATQKKENFMGVTNQAAALVQILSSPVKEDIGKYKIFVFSTFGPNATVANMINTKLNPSKEKLEQGFKKEDVFDLFESHVLVLECKETVYPGENGKPSRKGRDFTKSEWAPSKRGAFVRIPDANDPTKFTEHVFSKSDIDPATGKIKPEVIPFFMELIKQLKNRDISIYDWFCYKAIGDPRNSEEIEKYLKDVQEKVDKIIPIIRNAKTIAEIAGSASTEENDSAKTIGGQSAADILKESAPSELAASILNSGGTEPAPSPVTAADTQQQAETAPVVNQTVQDILNQG